MSRMRVDLNITTKIRGHNVRGYKYPHFIGKKKKESNLALFRSSYVANMIYSTAILLDCTRGSKALLPDHKTDKMA